MSKQPLVTTGLLPRGRKAARHSGNFSHAMILLWKFTSLFCPRPADWQRFVVEGVITRLAGVKSSQKRFCILRETFVSRIVEAFLIGFKSKTDIAPIGSLRKIDDELDVFTLPGVGDLVMFVLRFDGFNLQAV